MTLKKTILISHPNFTNSIFNKQLINLIDIHKKNELFSIEYLDKKLKHNNFDLESEKELLKNTKYLIWQFPLYWYNCPISLRIWQDQIMSSIVYSGNNILKGMPLRVIFTAGANKNSYTHEGLNHYTLEEMLRPLEMCANAAQMIWEKPIGFFDCNEGNKQNVFNEMEKIIQKL